MLTSTVCAAVSAAGLGIALLTAYRRRFLAAARIAAWSLVPLGLVMTGIVEWLTDIVFKPTVWAGFGVLALSAVLFLITRTVERRRAGGRRGRREAAAAGRPGAVAPAASAPSLGPARAKGPRHAGTKPPAGDAEDFSDIEAILKKHGI
ncbi:hypothetical protein [Streptomyces griseocarneus]|uniref:hypothetical protein n=1 Tax=Streptomyces griseocarneus TaxID=51201 RepID=UPI00167DD2E3|nr:hypothetical protein [Streptomyces griseocarneus]MBZ6474481.1 hypothetical protein [Streptomyces griseocarneus]GHG68041.1 hypothetical protein GCM10018779_40470 [Streptomyces griseocarneus]